MKKYLLLFILLLVPFSVNAEEITYEIDSLYKNIFSFPFVDDRSITEKDYYYYSTSYIYEDGKYKLNNPSLKHYVPSFISYTCKSNLYYECESMYIVFKTKKSMFGEVYPSFKLSNGDDGRNLVYFMTSDSFTKEGNKYILNNPQEGLTYENVNYYHNDKYMNKYFCENRTNSCEELYYIYDTFERGFLIKSSVKDYLCGKGFEYKNGKYILKDIIPSKWPNYEDYVGYYSCMDNSKTCDTIYKINKYNSNKIYASYNNLESIIPDYYNLTKIESDNKRIDLKIGDTYSISKYINDNTYTWIEDESILKIKDKKIIPLKIGSTNILLQNDSDVVLFKVNITDLNKDSSNISNPNTGNYIIVFIILVLSSLLIVTIYRLKRE